MYVLRQYIQAFLFFHAVVASLNQGTVSLFWTMDCGKKKKKRDLGEILVQEINDQIAHRGINF